MDFSLTSHCLSVWNQAKALDTRITRNNQTKKYPGRGKLDTEHQWEIEQHYTVNIAGSAATADQVSKVNMRITSEGVQRHMMSGILSVQNPGICKSVGCLESGTDKKSRHNLASHKGLASHKTLLEPSTQTHLTHRRPFAWSSFFIQADTGPIFNCTCWCSCVRHVYLTICKQFSLNPKLHKLLKLVEDNVTHAVKPQNTHRRFQVLIATPMVTSCPFPAGSCFLSFQFTSTSTSSANCSSKSWHLWPQKSWTLKGCKLSTLKTRRSFVTETMEETSTTFEHWRLSGCKCAKIFTFAMSLAGTVGRIRSSWLKCCRMISCKSVV